MADLATLAIKVENGDVVKATTSLDGLTVAGSKAEKATANVTRRMALLEIEARKMDETMGRGRLSIAGLATSMGVSEAAAAKLSTALSAVSVAAAGIAAVVFIGRKTIAETIEAQNALAQLEAAVKSTGGVAGRSVDQLDALSASLQRTTTFSDEAVKGAEAMLLTFDKIRGTEFDRATQAVADLATRMGGDLQGAAVQVGKALQDPETGLTALRRSGVSFSASQIEVIKQLYATGRAAEGQRVILKELEHQFGGSAAAARDTLGGALTALKNAWGDLFEVSGHASQGTVNAINAITKSLETNGLSMNQFVLNTVVGWEKIKASAQKAHEIMSLPIGPGFFARAKAISDRIDFDLNAKIAELNAPAKVGPAVKPPPIPIDVDTKQAKKDLAELQKATDAYYNSLNQHQIDAIKAASNTRAENDQLREMIAAMAQGEDAVEALTIAQAGANAVRQLGIGVSEKAAAAVRKEAEEHERLAIAMRKAEARANDESQERKREAEEAQREMERRARDARRALSGAIEGAITDVSRGKNPLISLVDGFKAAMVRALSLALADKVLSSRFAAMLGLGVEGAVKQQQKAGDVMNEASRRQLRAAEIMAGITPSEGPSGRGGGIVIEDTSRRIPTWLDKVIGALKTVVPPAIVGAMVGYGTGQSTFSTSHGTTGNYARGAVGGAITGAVAGSAFGPIGTIVGGLTGLVGGIFGTSKAMKEAAKLVTDAVAAVGQSMDALKARNDNNPLAASIAAVEEQRKELAKAIEDAWSGGDANSDRVQWRTQKLKEMNAAQDQYIRQLKDEAALKLSRATEDFNERALRADAQTATNEGRTADAAALMKQADDADFENKRRAEREDLRKSFGDIIGDLPGEAEAWAAYLKADAAEVKAHYSAVSNATSALNAFSTAVRNAPTGFKLEPYIQQFATASPLPVPMPSSKIAPPSRPNFSTALSAPTTTGTVATAPITIVNPTFTFPNVTDGRAAADAFLTRLDETKNSTGGMNMTRAAALELMKKSNVPALRS